MPNIVLLSEAKNLIVLGSYAFEILRLTPQNDIVRQPLNPALRKGDFFDSKDFPPFVKPHRAGINPAHTILTCQPVLLTSRRSLVPCALSLLPLTLCSTCPELVEGCLFTTDN